VSTKLFDRIAEAQGLTEYVEKNQEALESDNGILETFI